MNKLTRILTMGGFGLLAALATGAGAAQAASPTAVPEAKAAAGHNVQWGAGDEVVGYYRTLQGCELAGQYGERAGDWDDHNCSITRIGVRSGAWALQVSSDDDWNQLGFGVPFGDVGHFPGQFRPVWAGQWNHGRPGQFGHGGNNHGGNNHGGNNHGGNNHGGNNHGGNNHGGNNHGGNNHGGNNHGGGQGGHQHP
jgi:hypothetical protein